jgi:hypothetical protein
MPTGSPRPSARPPARPRALSRALPAPAERRASCSGRAGARARC